MSLAALILGQDLATAVCGLFNAGYFVRLGGQPATAWSRRLGALALAGVSAATAADALFSQTLFWADAGLIQEPSEGVWALVRLPSLVVTAAVSAIVLRRILSS